MNCSQTRKSLSAYIDGELFGREAAAVVAHVEACPSCQLELQDLTLVKDMLASLPRVHAPASLQAGVMARLHELAAGQAADNGDEAAAETLAPVRRSRRPAAAAWRFGWKAGVAAAAVAAFAFAWGLRLTPQAPLVADGGPPEAPAESTLPQTKPEQPVDAGPGPVDEMPGSDAETPSPDGTPTQVAVTPPADPPGQTAAEVPAEPAAEPADDSEPGSGGEEEALPPGFIDRVGTANAQLPASERMVAKTMQVSLVVADREAFLLGLQQLIGEYGADLVDGEEGAYRVLVPKNDERTMALINAIRDLGVADTFKYDQLSETDVTEAVRNLMAERDYLQTIADGDENVLAELRRKEEKLAEYFRETDHLTLDIVVRSLGE